MRWSGMSIAFFCCRSLRPLRPWGGSQSAQSDATPEHPWPDLAPIPNCSAAELHWATVQRESAARAVISFVFHRATIHCQHNRYCDGGNRGAPSRLAPADQHRIISGRQNCRQVYAGDFLRKRYCQEMHPVIPVHIEEQPSWALRHMYDGRNLALTQLLYCTSRIEQNRLNIDFQCLEKH